MKIQEAYRLAVETGMSKDVRPKDEVDRILADARSTHDALPEDRRELYDTERLWNPYADTRLSYLPDEDIDAVRMMWGIDIGPAEVLLADRLREKGETISAIVGHHPLGTARTRFPEVIALQSDLFHNQGVPINIAEALVGPRMNEVLQAMQGLNYNQAVDAAKLLGIPIMNIHCPADNMVQAYLTDFFEREEPRTLGDLVDSLYKEPEFREAAKCNSPPNIAVGSKTARCGRIVCKMNGGTSAPKDIYKALADAGVGTVVGMHFPDNHYDAAREAHVNLVISGHMSSDSLGINLLCDVWEREGIDVLPCSGFTRFSRNRDVREVIDNHPRRIQTGLRLRTEGAGQQGGAAPHPGASFHPPGQGGPRLHRVPHRRRGNRKDGHRQALLRRYDRVLQFQRNAAGHHTGELQEQELRIRRGAPAHKALRQGVPGQGVLHRGDVQGPQDASGRKHQEHRDNPGRGGPAPEEGRDRPRVPAHPLLRRHRVRRQGIADNDLPVQPRRAAGPGIAFHFQTRQQGALQQIHRARAVRHRPMQVGGGDNAWEDLR